MVSTGSTDDHRWLRRAPWRPSRNHPDARADLTMVSTGSTDEHRWLRRAPWRPSRNHPYGERRPDHGLDRLDRRPPVVSTGSTDDHRWSRQARPTSIGGLDRLDRRPP